MLFKSLTASAGSCPVTITKLAGSRLTPTPSPAAFTNPERTVTSTIKCEDGQVVSVKTDRPIPKEKMAEAMKIINEASPDLPISVGDVIIEDVFGSKVIATRNIG